MSQESLAALEPVRLNERLPEVYLQFANSEPALCAYLHMETALQNSMLELRAIECIKLLVSEHNQCDYCLSIHSYKSRQAGIDTDMQLAIRRGERLDDARLDAISRLVRSLLQQPGVTAPELLADMRAQGISDAELVDICMAMSTIFFTNVVNHINDTESPLTPAPTLATTQA